jgi:hypothetical protein
MCYAADVLEEYAKPLFEVNTVLAGESVLVRWAGSHSDPMRGGKGSTVYTKHKTPPPTPTILSFYENTYTEYI